VEEQREGGRAGRLVSVPKREDVDENEHDKNEEQEEQEEQEEDEEQEEEEEEEEEEREEEEEEGEEEEEEEEENGTVGAAGRGGSTNSKKRHRGHRLRQQQQQQEKHLQHQRRQSRRLLNLSRKEVPTLTSPLERWLIRRLCENKAARTACGRLRNLRRALLALRPCLPSSRSSTPFSLQAALLQPVAQKAMFSYYKGMEERWRGRVWAAKEALSALKNVLGILKLRIVRGREDDRLVTVNGGNERWKGWKEGVEEDEEEEDEGEEEEEDALGYPSRLSHAPSLSPALQDWLIDLFRDDTLIDLIKRVSNAFWASVSSGRVSKTPSLPPSFPPPRSPPSKPFASGCWRHRRSRQCSCN
jgi:hypothetical protein